MIGDLIEKGMAAQAGHDGMGGLLQVFEQAKEFGVNLVSHLAEKLRIILEFDAVHIKDKQIILIRSNPVLIFLMHAFPVPSTMGSHSSPSSSSRNTAYVPLC